MIKYVENNWNKTKEFFYKMDSYKLLLLLPLILSSMSINCLSSTFLQAIDTPTVIVESPSTADHGDWGDLATCSGYPEKLVIGFQLRVDYRDPINEDNTALNGIWFACGNPFRGQNQSEDDLQSRRKTEWISSANASFGHFHRRHFCGAEGGGYAIGFQLKSQQDQGPRADDVGAVNLKMICADGEEIEGYEENENLYPDAEYTEPIKCPERMGVCGIQTQVDEIKWGEDNTALNNIRIQCCPVPEEELISTTLEYSDDTSVTIIAGSNEERLQQRVKLFENQEGIGNNESISITSGQCNPIPEGWLGRVGSLEYKADCIRIWETNQCSGHTRCHCDDGFMSLTELMPMSKNVSSWKGHVSGLSMCRVDNKNFTSFRLFSEKRFNGDTEYLVLVAHECLTFYEGDKWRGNVASMIVVDGCVEYFEGEECTGKSQNVTRAHDIDTGSEIRDYEMIKSIRNCAADVNKLRK